MSEFCDTKEKQKESTPENSDTVIAPAVKKAKVAARSTIVFGFENLLSFASDKPEFYWSNACPDIEVHTINGVRYYFYPNYSILFDHLLSKNCIIVLFSSNTSKEENLLSFYLIAMFGLSRAKMLVQQGQVVLRYQQHLKDGKMNLNTLIRPDQTLNDIILINNVNTSLYPIHCYLEVQDFKNGLSYISGLLFKYFDNEDRGIAQVYFNFLFAKYNTKDCMVNPITKIKVDGLIIIRDFNPKAVYHVPNGDFMPKELIPSIKEVKNIIDELHTGERNVQDSYIIMFRRQFKFFFAPYYKQNMSADQITKLDYRVREAIRSGNIELHL